MQWKAICFDFDYTLGDSTDSIVAGFQHGLTGLGWPAPDRETVRGTIGYLLEDAYTRLTGDDDAEHRARFRTLFKEVAHPRQKEETTLFPGAVELLHSLRAQGLHLGIVSTKSSDILEYVLRRHGVLEDLELIIGSDRVTRHKPDPEGLLAAMAQMGVAPEETLFCGDTVLDAGAARNAGTQFAAVLNGTTPASDFRGWPCVHIAPDLWDLGRWLAGRVA